MTALVRHEARRYLVPIAVVSLLSTGATLAAPRLAGSPLLLMALAPRLPFLLLAGDRVPLLLFFLVGVVRLCVTDMHYFALGRRYGPGALDRLRGFTPLQFRRPDWLPRWRLPAGTGSVAAIVVRPIGRHLVIAGARGASSTAVAVADIVGTTAYLVAIRWAGAAIW